MLKVKTFVDDEDERKLQETLRHAAVMQNAIHPLDQARAEGTVEGLLLKGTHKPKLIERAGYIVFGGFFLLGGIAMPLGVYDQQQHWTFNIMDVVGLTFAAIGVKVVSNAFRSNNGRDKQHD